MNNLNEYQQLWAAIYTCDREAIWQYYKARSFGSRYWTHLSKDEAEDTVLLPLASDITRTSSNLLFGEPVKIEAEGQQLLDFLEANPLESFLLESADVCAGMGGVFLKIDIQSDLSDFPILNAKSPYNVIAKFRYNILESVKFLKYIKNDLYLIESRELENGNLIINYDIQTVNRDGYLTNYTLQQGDDFDIPENDVIAGAGCLGCVYVPNRLPNRNFIESPQGESDFSGIEPLLSAINETYTAWMTDIELARAQLFVDESLVVNGEFNKKQKAYQEIDLSEWRITGDSGGKPIIAEQFAIRWQEHKETAMDLINQAVSRAGYSPQSFGIDSEGIESGRALKIKERKSMQTRKNKSRYWKHGIQELLVQVQLMDMASGLSSAYEPERPEVEFDKFIHESTQEVSETLLNLSRAEAASEQTMIKMLHPEWTGEQVEEEQERIHESDLPSEMINA